MLLAILQTQSLNWTGGIFYEQRKTADIQRMFGKDAEKFDLYTQNYLTELKYMDPKDAKLEASLTLGHKRISITRVYAAEKKF